MLTAPPGPPGGPASACVLVAVASKHGSTREIADQIAATLRAADLLAEVRAAADVRSLEPYDAVVLGSGLYSATWLREANRFVRAHAAALRARPVWLFSSGPLDQSARWADLPMTPHVAAATAAVEPRGHRTFGGRLLADTPGLDQAVLATHRIGDFRDWEAIRAWAAEIAAALR
jgi:menaquinone-dependent protoporphyrinogen oxidase